MTASELLARYQALGFRLVAWERNGDPSEWKGPHAKGWNDPARTFDPAAFDPTKHNLGLFTGCELTPGKFVADLDFDWAPGLDVAPKLIPSTGFAFGRKGKKLSHAIFTTPERVESIKFCDYADEEKGTGEGTTFIELRGGNFSQQTMIAPSLHSPGVSIELVLNGAILHVEVDRLRNAALDYAIACMLLKRVPGGLHHEGRVALAGFLLRAGFSPERTTLLIEEVCRVQASRGVHDMSAKDVADAVTVVRSTQKRFEAGRKAAGGPTLAEWIGPQGKHVLARLNAWLGRDDDFIRDRDGRIVPKNQENIRRAIELLGHELSFDEFAGKLLVDGRPMEDREVNCILTRIEIEHRFQPPEAYFERVIKFLAWQRSFHPVKQYLDALRWDGVPRIDEWLIRAAGVEDNEYTRAVSSIMLIAAVRRVRRPGCKYDEMVIFEDPTQGTDKSTAVAALCPNPAWFSDDLPLNIDSKQMIEKTLGKWIVEASDLAGRRRAEVEQLKATLSRGTDGPARLAYAHFPVERPRHFIVIGTTNGRAYLLDINNRRFWPLAIGHRFDVAWIVATRDQLWAEACVREADGESIRLPERLWPLAAQEQEKRREIDPWEDVLRRTLLAQPISGDGRRRVATEVIWTALNIATERRDRSASLRVSDVMQKLGFKRTRVRDDSGDVVVGFVQESEGLELEEGEDVEVRRLPELGESPI